MITCHVRYVLDPNKIAEFEQYASSWLRIIPRLGGRHHGYYLPDEGANNIAICLFSFDSLTQYERYRETLKTDGESQETLDFGRSTGCILSYERSFFRPLIESRGSLGL